MEKPTKLIIWDFDGVIADSEHLWVQNWLNALSLFKNIKLSASEEEYYIRGKADKTKVELLQRDFPHLQFEEDFWNYLKENEIRLIASQLTLTPDIERIFADTRFAHCIATGATEAKNLRKIEKLQLQKYFGSHNMFTAYDVKYGKPEPDLFLYAAAQMGYEPKDCIVIEDSLVGITAGVRAQIPVIAYIGATGNNNDEYAEKCRKAGARNVVSTMTEVYDLLHQFI